MLLGDETKWRLIESDGGKGPMEAKKKGEEEEAVPSGNLVSSR